MWGRPSQLGNRKDRSLTARNRKPSLPPRRPSTCRRLYRPGVYPAPRDHPCDDRVRVPHLTGAKLVAAPDGSWDLLRDVERPPRNPFVRTQSPRAIHGLGDVRNVSAAAQANLVAEDPKAARPVAANGALGDDSPLAATPVVDRRLLDHVFCLGQLQLQRGVVEVARRSSLQSCRDGLVDATVEPDEVAARPERQPVEVHRGVTRHPAPHREYRSDPRWVVRRASGK
jgi:hypothetical protein